MSVLKTAVVTSKYFLYAILTFQEIGFQLRSFFESCGGAEWVEGSNRCGDCKEWCELFNEE